MPKKEWDNFAKEYDNLVQDTGDIYHKTYLKPLTLKLLGNIKNKKILDLACGNGYFSNILAKKGAIVTGVDYSKELIKIADKNKTKNTKFITASSTNLSILKNNSIDYIVSNIAFHDIKNIPGTIEECSRLLKPKSKLIFSIPHPAFYLSKKIHNDKGYYRKVKSYMFPSVHQHPHFKDINCYKRPIEYYLKLLFKNKFVVSGFYEISTRHKNGKIIENPKLLKFKQEIPTFLIIEATSIK